ncbi:MAG: hypothetical protein M0Q51_09035 [Bacteroidales bacterium]|nr:hypothetical protein [Bacteroidales bacterium]
MFFLVVFYQERGSCDFDYFRTNFTIVNYVNDNKDADVHILVTSLPTGSGGSAYSIILLGQGRYKYMIDTVIFNMSQDITAEVARIVCMSIQTIRSLQFTIKCTITFSGMI